MIRRCEACYWTYDDAEFTTVCPHTRSVTGRGILCRYHDLFNCPHHGGKPYMRKPYPVVALKLEKGNVEQMRELYGAHTAIIPVNDADGVLFAFEDGVRVTAPYGEWYVKDQDRGDCWLSEADFLKLYEEVK